MTRTPLERREYQFTITGEQLLYYPMPLPLQREQEDRRKQETINDSTGG